VSDLPDHDGHYFPALGIRSNNAYYPAYRMGGSTIWDGRIEQPTPQVNVDIEALANKIMKKMYDAPVIVVCNFCNSCNAITNSTCVRCNAPLGEATRRDIKASQSKSFSMGIETHGI